MNNGLIEIYDYGHFEVDNYFEVWQTTCVEIFEHYICCQNNLVINLKNRNFSFSFSTRTCLFFKYFLNFHLDVV